MEIAVGATAAVQWAATGYFTWRLIDEHVRIY